MQDVSISVYFSFKPYWENGVKLGRKFMTIVVPSNTGKEMRSILLDSPRRTITYAVRTRDENESFHLKKILRAHIHQVYGVPVFPYEMVLTSKGVQGTNTLTVDSTDYRDMSNFGYAILLKGYNNFEAASILSYDSTHIYLGSVLESDWVVGSKVYPVMPCVLSSMKELGLPTPQHMEAEFEFVEAFRMEES